MSLLENIQQVKQRIDQACEKSSRNVSEVKIIAVTKYIGVEETKHVLESGLTRIGENKVQSAIPKHEALSSLGGEWHFIGYLQTNKVKQIIGKFDYIHSLDRLSLAEAIHKRATQLQTRVKCLIQVNVSGEESKGGVDPKELFDFCQSIRHYETLEIVGLMTMAPHINDTSPLRDIFRGLRELRDQINQQQLFDEPLLELSMGMSNDFEIAVEEGATFVRLGTVLFKS
ncbi:YggS family pyridoxal phosphate-dependent enzyme [Tepidibacillus marianensis]|uniref:YggS family pyridoxal phosphate-dependent enzyme n=1 Tax=Tepidibacillus marianensis TaxID=3131995 RepID=UPI0030D3EA39